jgi:hypothetical protein
LRLSPKVGYRYSLTVVDESLTGRTALPDKADQM